MTKRIISLFLILLLVLPSAVLAEGLAGASREKLLRQIGVWGLTEQHQGTLYGYDTLEYADSEHQISAALICTGDSVVAAVYTANNDAYGKAYLREMSMSTVMGSNYLVQMVYGLFLELAMDELVDGESRGSELDGFLYEANRQGTILSSSIVDVEFYQKMQTIEQPK